MDPIISTPAAGVTFLALTDERFTTSRITVSLYLPLAEETAGTYAVLPFLLRRGCRRLPTTRAFQRRLESLYGASMEADITGAGETQILELSMSCLNDRFSLDGQSITARCAQLLLDVLFDPPLTDEGLFREEDVAQERRCTLESIAAEINDKRRYAMAQTKALLCQGEPYAVSKYGTAETVKGLTPADLTAAWKCVLRTAPIRVIYQGPDDGAAVKEAFASRLRSREVLTLPPVVRAPAKETVARQNEPMDVKQCQLVLGLRTRVMEEEPLVDAMRVAVALLGGTPHSLLFLHVREEQSLCYYCAARYDRRKGIVLIDSGVEEATLETAEQAILEQLDALKSGAFSDETLEYTKLSLLDSLAAATDSAAATANWYSAQGPDEVRTPDDVAAAVKAVTREQVLEAAATLTLDCVYTLTPSQKEESV